jgi:hypothetical protein
MSRNSLVLPLGLLLLCLGAYHASMHGLTDHNTQALLAMGGIKTIFGAGRFLVAGA